MELIFLSYLPAVVGLYLISVASYQNNSHQRVNKLFSLFTGVIATWLLLLLFSDTASDYDQALFFLRAALFAGTPIGLSFLLFCDEFPNGSQSKLPSSLKKTLTLVTLVFMGLALTNHMVSVISLNDGGADIEKATLVYALQSLFVVGQVVAGLVLVYRKRKRSSVAQRLQIKLFGRGMLLAVGVNSLTGVIFIFVDIGGRVATLLTGLSLLGTAVFVWLAVTRHGMFHIRSAVSRAIGYGLSIFLLSALYTLVIGVAIDHFVDSEPLRLILLGVTTMLVVIFLEPIKSFFDKTTNKFFYREAYSSRQKLNELTDILVSHIKLDELIEKSSEIIRKTVKPSKLTIGIVVNKQLKFFGDMYWLDDSIIGDHLSDDNLILDSILIDMLPDVDAVKYREAGIDLIAPLRSSEQLEGYLLLGPHSSGSYYSIQDLTFLNIAAKNIGLAINNARSYLEIADFNRTLKTKIRQATQELRDTNSELENLHKTKDDFISMASHQLKPKLTASKGFLEMLRRSDLKTTKDQTELIQLVDKGIKQMNDIVTDMLDINHMDKGYIQLGSGDKPVSILELTHEEITMVEEKKKSRFTLLVSPKKSKALVRADKIKIREVINNLLTNAYQYSINDKPINVKLKELKDSVELKVIDEGIGMTEEEQLRLFSKFYRSQESKRIRPIGSGLGLYVSKKIIEAHGGKMIVRSKKDKGSTFGFSIPKDLTKK